MRSGKSLQTLNVHSEATVPHEIEEFDIFIFRHKIRVQVNAPVQDFLKIVVCEIDVYNGLARRKSAEKRVEPITANHGPTQIDVFDLAPGDSCGYDHSHYRRDNRCAQLLGVESQWPICASAYLIQLRLELEQLARFDCVGVSELHEDPVDHQGLNALRQRTEEVSSHSIIPRY